MTPAWRLPGVGAALDHLVDAAHASQQQLRADDRDLLVVLAVDDQHRRLADDEARVVLDEQGLPRFDVVGIGGDEVFVGSVVPSRREVARAGLVDLVEELDPLRREHQRQVGLRVGGVPAGGRHAQVEAVGAVAQGGGDQRELRRRCAGHRADHVELGRPLLGDLVGEQHRVPALGVAPEHDLVGGARDAPRAAGPRARCRGCPGPRSRRRCTGGGRGCRGPRSRWPRTPCRARGTGPTRAMPGAPGSLLGAHSSAMPVVPCAQESTGRPPSGASPVRHDDDAADRDVVTLERLRVVEDPVARCRRRRDR